MITVALIATWLLACWQSLEVRRRSLNILIRLDQLAWVVITLGNGHPDETISAALWRMERQGKRAGRWFRPVVDALFYLWERGHCRRAYEAEARGAQLPKSYRGD